MNNCLLKFNKTWPNTKWKAEWNFITIFQEHGTVFPDEFSTEIIELLNSESIHRSCHLEQQQKAPEKQT